MSKVKKSKYFVHLVSILTMLFLLSLLQGQEHKKIVEKVIVENIEIPVRVFQGKQPVGGLKKEDFQLFLNGKRKEINGFYEVRKNLVDNLSRDSGSSEDIQRSIPPRLFVVIFNLSSITRDLTSQLDIFFERIIRPNDRLMVLTNRFFISEWEVVNKEEVRRKIKEILDKEMHQLRMEMLAFEINLRAIASTLKFQIANSDSDANILAALQEFFFNYRLILEGIKDLYNRIPVEQYIKIAEYLKSQQADKWVINFYQMGRLPLLDKTGAINRIVGYYLDSGSTVYNETLRQHYYDVSIEIKKIDTLFINDIAKAFVNSGATVHTQLLLPIPRHLSEDFKYETISTESSSIMTNLSRLTGGKVLTSNRTEKFIKDITTREDIIYVLTYAPNTGERKKTKLTVKVKNRNYRLTYDNKKRLKSFKGMVERLTQNIKDLEIESLSCNNRMITFKLKNIQLVQYEGEKFWAVQARIKILDQHSHFITSFKKVYKREKISDEEIFRIKLPSLGKGRYHIVLEVKDLFSLKSVTAGDAISIKY